MTHQTGFFCRSRPQLEMEKGCGVQGEHCGVETCSHLREALRSSHLLRVLPEGQEHGKKETRQRYQVVSLNSRLSTSKLFGFEIVC